MKSVLSNRFRGAIAALLTLSCAAGGVGQSGKPTTTAGPILNMRQVATAGPQLSDEASLTDPAAVIANGIGEIFVSDRAANTIFKFSSALEYQAKEGSPSSSEFNKPLGMACDAALNLYVIDNGNHRIQLLDHNLRFARSITSYTNQNNESVDFSLPGDISIDGEGNFWVADDTRILKLDPFFNLLLEISNDVPGPIIVGRVSSIKISRNGVAAIADIGSQRVALVSIAGNYAGEITLSAPQSVAWDKDGDIWVVEQGRLAAYDIKGNRLFEYASDEPGARFAWVAIDSGGRLLLVDNGLRQVKVFEIVRGAAPAGGK